MKNSCPSRIGNLKQFMGKYDEDQIILENNSNI